MTHYIIFSDDDVKKLVNNEPLFITLDGAKYKICTEECYEKEVQDKKLLMRNLTRRWQNETLNQE